MAFNSELEVLEIGLNEWEVRRDLVYEGRDERLTVSKGEKTDFASVPKLLRWFIPKYGRYNKPAVLHDYLCRLAKESDFSRADADGIFRRAMRELGVGYVRRRLMWVGVRWGGKLKGAGVNEVLIILAITVVAGPFVIGGYLIAQILYWLYQLLELIVYLIRIVFKWIFRRDPPPEPAPKPTVYMAS